MTRAVLIYIGAAVSLGLVASAVPVCHADHPAPRLQVAGLILLGAGLAVLALAVCRANVELRRDLHRARAVLTLRAARILELERALASAGHVLDQLIAGELTLEDMRVASLPEDARLVLATSPAEAST